MLQTITIFISDLFQHMKGFAVGATEQYATELHQLGAAERLRGAIAQEFALNPLVPDQADIIEDVVWLRLSVAERLVHFADRWEREVAPRLAALGERFIGPLPAPMTGPAPRTFADIPTGAYALLTAPAGVR